MIPKRVFWLTVGYGAGLGSSWYATRKVREAQAQEVVRTVAALNTENLPVVIAGDFASSRAELGGNKPYDVFMSSGLQNPLGDTAAIPAVTPPAGSRTQSCSTRTKGASASLIRRAPAVAD